MNTDNQAPRRRVVITGQGVVTPIGHSVSDFWESLLQGRSGVGRITQFDASDLPVQIAGEVKGFEPTDYMPRTVSRRVDRFAQFAVAAAMQALDDAKLVINGGNSDRIGVLVGSGYGATGLLQNTALQLESRGVRSIAPWVSAASAIDSAAGEIALRLGATGPSGAVSTACASGTTSIGQAMRLIQHGEADVIFAGGSDNAVTSVDIASGATTRALSRRNDSPESASRPFDSDRDGFVMSGGAGILVLESLEHAMDRGAPILAEVIGYGETSDAHHPTAPHPEGRGAQRAMRLAMADAGVEPGEVDYINAHGTSTLLNDRTESAAIRQVFGDHAPKLAISSVKSMTGHMIGAAGSVELIATVQAIRNGVVPPTINCHNPEDPGLNYVPHVPQERKTVVAMSNSFGFAGHNAVVVVRAVD